MVVGADRKLVGEYLRYRLEVDQISDASAKVEEFHLRHLLAWTGDKPLSEAAQIRPAFAEYLKSARLDGRGKPLSAEYCKKIVRDAKRFFKWMTTNRPGHELIPRVWIESLKPPRGSRTEHVNRAVSLEEVLVIARAPAELPWERRIRAAAVFLFISGIRVGAFVSLPLSAVDVGHRAVKQWPELGIRTKNGRRATTYLLPIEDLLAVVSDWDQEVRRALPMSGYWFAPLSSQDGSIAAGQTVIGEHRHARVRKDLRRWLESVQLPYRSPHQFRHGHAVYALKQAQDMADLKAVSQNLMHSNLSVTDGVYGVLSEEDTRTRIGALGRARPADSTDLLAQMERRLSRLERALIGHSVGGG